MSRSAVAAQHGPSVDQLGGIAEGDLWMTKPSGAHELRSYRKRGRGSLSTSQVLGTVLVTLPSPGEMMPVKVQQGASLIVNVR